MQCLKTKRRWGWGGRTHTPARPGGRRCLAPPPRAGVKTPGRGRWPLGFTSSAQGPGRFPDTNLSLFVFLHLLFFFFSQSRSSYIHTDTLKSCFKEFLYHIPASSILDCFHSQAARPPFLTRYYGPLWSFPSPLGKT